MSEISTKRWRGQRCLAPSLTEHGNAPRLGLRASGFILVNSARFELVDEAALLADLASGRIGHAALDVFPDEPLLPGNPYASLANAS